MVTSPDSLRPFGAFTHVSELPAETRHRADRDGSAGALEPADRRGGPAACARMGVSVGNIAFVAVFLRADRLLSLLGVRAALAVAAGAVLAVAAGAIVVLVVAGALAFALVTPS